MVDTPSVKDGRLERAIVGALRAAIRDHGPITADTIGRAAKRILGSLRSLGLGRSADGGAEDDADHIPGSARRGDP